MSFVPTLREWEILALRIEILLLGLILYSLVWYVLLKQVQIPSKQRLE